MKFFPSSITLPALIAAACVALPAVSHADHKVTVYRDRDGDGHFNKKTYDTRGHGSNHHGYGGYYGGYGGYRGGYYAGPRYYGRPYYNYGYYRPYFGPSVGLSFYTEPDYYTERTTVYREAPQVSGSENLAVDVQRELRRRGFYSGPVDGDIGPGSRAAIRAYQEERGLPITGRIDTALIRSLGVG